jgi:hypothetical protein
MDACVCPQNKMSEKSHPFRDFLLDPSSEYRDVVIWADQSCSSTRKQRGRTVRIEYVREESINQLLL